MSVDLFTSSGSDGSLAAAGRWIEEILAGQFTVAIAVIAVAVIGYELMLGRISMRRTASVFFGCFLLLGAPAMTAVFFDASYSPAASASPQIVFTEAVEPPLVPAAQQGSARNPFDPRPFDESRRLNEGGSFD